MTMIDHIAIWVDDLEVTREFYIKYFNVTCNGKYTNTKRNYSSYFLSFDGHSTRIELMHIPAIIHDSPHRGSMKGLAHLAISLHSKTAVDNLTERLRNDGYIIASEPRTSGDGYYESAVLDPEGNYIELVG